MKKFRILAVILAVLMLPMSLFVACDNSGDGSGDGSTEEYCVGGKHRFGPKQIISKRTCDTPGIEERTCTRCPYVDRKETPARGHALGDAVSDNSGTCTEDGTASQKCGLCSYRETVSLPGSALGHLFINYTKLDEYSEMSVCHRCGVGTHTRLTGLNIDFEGDKTHASYDKLTVFTDTEAVYNKETLGEIENSYLSVSRGDGIILGSTEFGVVLNPRADVLQGVSIDLCPSYIVEFSVRIKKEETKDLILLQGSKNGVKETFLTYDSAAGTINSNEGVVYLLAEEDYGNWLDIAVRLNDGAKVYEIYINNKIVTGSADSATTTVAYVNKDAYFMGYPLESLKIVMDAANGVASSFDVDNIKLYVADEPNDYEGEANVGYGVIVLKKNENTGIDEKLVYKLPEAGCACTFTAGAPVAATCVSSGYTIESCGVCGGEKVTNIVAPSAHNWVSQNVVDASCTVAAYENFICENCDSRDIKYSGEPAGHKINTDPATGYKIVAPHCLTEGWTEGVCATCGFGIKIDVVEPLGHSLDYVTEGAITITAPTCLEEGYSSGNCVRHDDNGDIKGCGYVFEKTDVVEALGHLCTNPIVHVATCTERGYDECVCEREGCGEEYEENEMAALGHATSSVIKVVDGVTTITTKCSVCGEITSSRPVSLTPPTSAEMKSMFEEFDIENALTSSTKLNFDGDTVGYKRGDANVMGTSVDSVVARYGEVVTKNDMMIENNLYGEMYYKGNINGEVGSDGKVKSDHFYFEPTFNADGRQFVLEMSFRKTRGEDKVLPLSFSTLESNSKVQFYPNFLKIYENGDISTAGGELLGTITAEKWTRLAIVYNSNPGVSMTFDYYIDGKLVGKDMFIDAGNNDHKKDDGNGKYFRGDSIRGIRIERGGSSAGKRIDIDEVYAYYSDTPLYVIDTNGRNYSGMAFTDTSVNTVDSTSGLSYLKNGTISNLLINSGSNTHYEVVNLGTEDAPEYGLSIKKNASIAQLPDGEAGKDPEIKVTALQFYKKIVLENEIRINEGNQSGFTVFSGRKQSGETKFFSFLTYKNGALYTEGNDTPLAQIEIGKWYKVAVTLNEITGIYSIYVDGEIVLENARVSESYLTTSYKLLEYKLFQANTAAVLDISYKNTNVRGGATLPTFLAEEGEETPPAEGGEGETPEGGETTPDAGETPEGGETTPDAGETPEGGEENTPAA